jgi:hypothetical protein
MIHITHGVFPNYRADRLSAAKLLQLPLPLP